MLPNVFAQFVGGPLDGECKWIEDRGYFQVAVADSGVVLSIGSGGS